MATPPLKRILMVGDEVDIQALARITLQAIGGFTVEFCSSGSEAIKTAPIFAADLILLDVMMPGMDSLSTFTLRKIPQTATTPVIFTTAKVQPNEVIQYKAMGALDVITKPFYPTILSATITNIWTQCYGYIT